MAKEKIRVLFWDFDGVANSAASAYEARHVERRIDRRLAKLPKDKREVKDREYARYHLGKREMNNLNQLMRDVPDIRLVISSTWRKGRTLEELRKLMVYGGFKYPSRVIDKTPVIYLPYGEFRPNYSDPTKKEQSIQQVRRGVEIAAWLDVAHTTKTWRVVDFLIVDDDADMVFLKHKLVQTDVSDGFTRAKVNEIMERFGEWDAIDHLDDAVRYIGPKAPS